LKYRYTSDNWLDRPITYAYAEFGGGEFLAAYVQDRKQAMARIGQALQNLPAAEMTQLLRRQFVSQPSGSCDGAAKLNALQIEQAIDTAQLLNCLLTAQLADAPEPAVTPWLDRLVQRFEVTKKLYARYEPGFRKGEGDAGRVALYLMLALVLCLRYHADGQLKYLNTMLKLTDLLCSLPAASYEPENLAVRLGLLIGAEVAAVRALASRKSVPIAA
jgi:hypothetical protein